MQVTYRPLTKAERAELEGYVSPGIALFRAALFVGAISAIGWLARGIQARAAAPGSMFANPAWWAIPLAILAGVVYHRARGWTGGRKFRTQIRADLQRGHAAVRRVVAVDAIEVEEQEDEGPAFFVKTEDGRTVLFAGQFLHRLKTKGFPWTVIEIIEAPESRRFFGIVGAGGRLQPCLVRPPFSWEEATRFKALGREYQVLEEDFDALKGAWLPAGGTHNA
jgi:hypothetical protein